MIAPECLHLRIDLLNAFTYNVVIPIHCKFIKINKWIEEVIFYYKLVVLYTLHGLPKYAGFLISIMNFPRQNFSLVCCLCLVFQL